VHLPRLFLLLAFGLALTSSLRATAPSYTLTDLGLPSPYAASRAVAISNSGSIVAGNLIDNTGFPHAFLYTGGNLTPIPVPSGYARAEAISMNNSGEIVGDLLANNGTIRGFTYSNGTINILGVLQNAPGRSYANDVNDAGTVVGASTLASYSNATVACVFPSTNITLKPGYFAAAAYSINSSNQVVVGEQGTYGVNLFLYANGNLTNLSIAAVTPASDARGYTINNYNEIIGTLLTNHHPFIYINGKVTDLAGVAGPNAALLDLNNAGVVVGANNGFAFVILGGTNYILGALTITGGSGWPLIAATGINDSGQIAGTGINPTDHAQHAIILTPTGGSGNAPAISTQPATVSARVNATTAFKVVAKIQLGTLFHYQWQRLPALSSVWANLANAGAYSGVTTANLSVKNLTAVMYGDQFRCIIAGSGGSTTSKAGLLKVEAVPIITSQPADTSVSVGTQAIFTTAANAYPLASFQWQRLPVGTTRWAKLANGRVYAGVGSATLLVNNTTVVMAGDQFHCIVKNIIGSVTSANVTLTVTP
jgi:probable HAF family extracellular repeat protein